MRGTTASAAGVVAVLFTLGCATTGAGGGGTKSGTSACLPFAGTVPDVVAVKDWVPPADLPAGFLRLQYYGDDPVYVVAVHYVDVTHITVPFIVGPLTGVPSGWIDDPKTYQSSAPPDWYDFFGKLRRVVYAKPGGLLCRHRDCGKAPDVPPPEIAGSGSTGGGGGGGALFLESPQRYAQRSTSGKTATDARAVAGAAAPSPSVVAGVVDTTCRGIQVILGRE